jgi:hypothetical protein
MAKEPSLFPARKLVASAVAAALLPAAVLYPVNARAQGACPSTSDIAVLPAPMTPWTGMPFRILFVSEKPLQGELTLTAPDGSVAARSKARHGGPPYYWYAEAKTPAAGTWHVKLAGDSAPAGCNTLTYNIAVQAGKPPRPGAKAGSVWPIRNTWNRQTENLYSAWIEKLFDAPLDVDLSWPALHVGLRDRSRNFLFDYLGLGEDQMKMVIQPDCADLPYFLRAYFSFKLGLPYGFSLCSRGSGGKAPYCPSWRSIQGSATSGSLAGAFGQYLRTLSDGVHSGNGRTALADNKTDYYPVALTQNSLRPGVTYADPYGHLLVLVRRVPQTADGAGVFLAVDGQPDGTVGRKRFWRGNFLFAKNPALGGPGFKRFRPIMVGKNGAWHKLTNAEIEKNPDYGDFSLEQGKLSVEGFYDRMNDVMSPEPLDPVHAMKDVITSLDEQVRVRVTSVENGRKYQNGGHGEIAMPNGAAIFETTGPWEDFSTPARDLRLLIAMDVVRGFPDQVARRPNRYAMPEDKTPAQVKTELDKVLADELVTRKFSYKRSDGSSWTLSLKDVFDRMSALEMAYNPNDCVELRWGAPPKSAEAATCRRHAPAAQRAKMAQQYRPWLHERRRPPRP